MNIVCFHNPNERNGYLSNWYMSDFRDENNTYTSMEKYMMYNKAILFKDYVIADKILKIDDVAKIKALGRKVKNFNDKVWDAHKEEIIENGCYLKFSQNDTLKQKLLRTGDDILAECAVKDKIWGIGLSMTDSRRLNIHEWRGQNLLGKALMNVREKLKDK